MATHAYDLADRLTSLTNAKPGQPPTSAYAYTYDPNGNRTKQVETNGLPPTTETTTYGYDALNRLASVNYPDKKVGYGYDAVGNRTSEIERDLADVELSNKVASFDAINRLESLTDSVAPANNTAFTYDKNGNQITKTQGGTTTEYRYDVRDKLAEVAHGASDPRSLPVRLRRPPQQEDRRRRHPTVRLRPDLTPRRVRRDRRPEGQVRLRLTGSSVSSDRRGAALLPPRRPRIGRQPHRRLGRCARPRYHLDAWGSSAPRQSSTRARTASASPGTTLTGRPASTTPAPVPVARDRPLHQPDTFLGSIDNPPSLHRYFYANANPIRYIDPTGHFSIKDFGKGAFNVVMEPFRQVADIAVAGIATHGMGIDAEDIQLTSMLGKAQRERVVEGQGAGKAALKGVGETAFAVGTVGIGPAVVSHVQLAGAFNRGEITIDQYDAALSEMAGGQAAAAAIAKAAGGRSSARASTDIQIQPKGASAVRIIEGNRGATAVPEGPVIEMVPNAEGTFVASFEAGLLPEPQAGPFYVNPTGRAASAGTLRALATAREAGEAKLGSNVIGAHGESFLETMLNRQGAKHTDVTLGDIRFVDRRVGMTNFEVKNTIRRQSNRAFFREQVRKDAQIQRPRRHREAFSSGREASQREPLHRQLQQESTSWTYGTFLTSGMCRRSSPKGNRGAAARFRAIRRRRGASDRGAPTLRRR